MTDLRTAAAPDLTFTLADICKHSPCADGWKKLLTALGENHAAPDLFRRVSLGDVARANGADDAFWCIRALDWFDLAVRRAVIAGALMPAVKRASAYATDPRVRETIMILDRWCGGDDTADIDKAAREAWGAAWEAALAAWPAALAAQGAAWEAAAGEAVVPVVAWEAVVAAQGAAWEAAAWEAAAWEAVAAAADAERAKQRTDIIAAFPPVAIMEEVE